MPCDPRAAVVPRRPRVLFAVGLDTPLSELKAVGARSIGVGAGGIVLPFAAGVGLLALWGNPMGEALFVGTAMVATSVGVTARVLNDLGAIALPVSRVILGAAVVDDILGLLEVEHHKRHAYGANVVLLTAGFVLTGLQLTGYSVGS